MAQPKHILNGIDPKAEAPLLMENLRELSDQMTLENMAGNRLVIKDENGLARVILGRQPNGFGAGKDYGIKVSQEGQDVISCLDDKLVMSSAFNTLKVVSTGTKTIVVPNPGSTNSLIIPHGLGYAPSFLVYGESFGYSFTVPFYDMNVGASSYICQEYADASVDTQNLYVNWQKHASAGSMGSGDIVTIRYYLFREVSN